MKDSKKNKKKDKTVRFTGTVPSLQQDTPGVFPPDEGFYARSAARAVDALSLLLVEKMKKQLDKKEFFEAEMALEDIQGLSDIHDKLLRYDI